MKVYNADSIRNIAVVGHGGDGKTTLVEAMLFNAGATERRGRVEDGNTTTDYDPEETKRHISLTTALAPIEWKNTKLNLIDAPGFFDFVGETTQAYYMADAALVLVNAFSGVGVGAEKAFQYCKTAGKPMAILVNQIDKEHASFDKTVEQLREKLEALTRAMQQAVVVLPSGSDLHISISGGVAWYPEDGRDIETLKKYADFAMYQVKHSTKGQMKDFDIGVYNQEAYIARTRREFHQLISEERVYYYFQPIFSAQTGRVHAYEALMRSDLPTLRSPATIMKLAREQGALYEIERLTFRKALEEFDNLRSKNLVDRQALIFINSIASVCLRREDSEYMDQRWHELRRQMVIEITEEEEMNREALETKRHAPGFSGMFALDDYGSGYSNEGSLLELAPRFIKVDISIIRGIDSDPDKQQILRNVVRYAQPRSMQIIAEGVETAAEMRTVIDLGADLLQGYFLARPAAVPDPIAPEAAEIIRAI